MHPYVNQQHNQGQFNQAKTIWPSNQAAVTLTNQPIVNQQPINQSTFQPTTAPIINQTTIDQPISQSIIRQSTARQSKNTKQPNN